MMTITIKTTSYIKTTILKPNGVILTKYHLTVKLMSLDPSTDLG